jgi:hypothetical protein
VVGRVMTRYRRESLNATITASVPIPITSSLLLKVLLLQTGTRTVCARWGANSEWVLAVRQTDATTLDEAIQSVPVKFVYSLRRRVHIIKLEKTGQSKRINKKTQYLPPQSTSDQCSSA